MILNINSINSINKVNIIKRKKVILAIFFFVLALTVFADFIFELSIQPYKGTEFFVNGKKLQAKFLKRDNSLAKVQLSLPDNIKSLEIKNKNFKTFYLEEKDFKKKKAFVVLQGLNSKYKTTKVFDTGRQPKSLVFVNKNTVAVALLQGSGFDLINIETGERRRISPPKQYAKNSVPL